MNENNNLSQLFLNDSIDQLQQSMIKWRNCLGQLSADQIAWRPTPQGNSIGILAVHICGNLKQWIRSGILGEPDTRDRQSEFAGSILWNGPELAQHLQTQVDDTCRCLNSLSAAMLTAKYTVQGFTVNGLQAINHTVTHFVGHTHQIILLTRMQLKNNYRFAWSPDQGRDSLPI